MATKATPNKLDERLHTEIVGLMAVSKKVVAKSEDGTVEIAPEKLGKAVDLLTLSRALVRDVETDFKEKTKEIAEKLVPYVVEKKAITQRAQELASEVEGGLYGLITTGDLKSDGYESKSGCKLTLVKRDGDLLVEDTKRVPRSYLLPPEVRVDMKAVALAYAEAKKRGDTDFSIPGIKRDVDTYTFRTTQPELVS